MQNNNVSFGMALKQDPNMMKRLVQYKTREIKFYNKIANKVHRFSNSKGVDIVFSLPEDTQKFGVTLAHRSNANISSAPAIENFPQTKKDMRALYKTLKDECKRLKTLFKIDKKFTKK